MSREWTFRSEITRPDGVVVSAAVSVPEDRAGKDVVDITEFTQMTAAGLLKRLQSSANSPHSAMFFQEVPF